MSKVWIYIICVLAFAALLAIVVSVSMSGRQQKLGRSEAVIEAQNQSLENVNDANQAEVDLRRRTAEQRRADCLQYARNPGNC